MADYKKIRIVDQSGTQLEEVNVKDEQARNDLEKKVLYYQNQAVSAAPSAAQIMRIPSSGTSPLITTDTVVLSCIFTDPSYIFGDVNWFSNDGYIIFTGTCSAAMTANVVLGTKSN